MDREHNPRSVSIVIAKNELAQAISMEGFGRNWELQFSTAEDLNESEARWIAAFREMKGTK